jgi:RNA ligase (TIGR02306 family)
MKKLASIEIIKNIRNHPNADSLELAEVLNWQVVIKKGLYKEGDKVIFITIDSIVPKCPWSEFLLDKKNPDKPIRVKNIKLRGEYSSGLVVPMIEFPLQFESLDIGDDVTELLGIKKYIKELPANLSGDNEGDFPTAIAPKTDEENGLNNPSLVQEVLDSDKIIVGTLKVDGTSITIIVDNGKITKVCSRNLSKKNTEESLYWNIAKKLNIPANWTGVIQGEIAGNGIQKNPLKLTDRKLFVFQILTKDNVYLNYNQMKHFCEDFLKCECVPLVFRFETDSTIKLWEKPIEKLQEMSDRQKYPNGGWAEGLVFRPFNYVRSKKSRRPLGFKLINRNYID